MRKIFLHSSLFVTLLLASYTIQAQTADEVIDKYLAAIGGKEKLKQVKSIKIDGQIEVQGLQIPFTVQSVHEKGMRVDAEFQGNKIIDIVTPTQGWSQNPLQGKTTMQPLSAEELNEKVDQLDIQDPFIDYKEKGSTVESLGKDEEDGNEYFKIKLTTKHKNEITYFFDLQTNLIYKQETTTKQQGQDVKMTTKNYDYRETDFGVKVPFKIDQGGFIMVTKKVTTNPVIDEKLFTVN